MTIQEAADSSIKKVRRPSWPAGKYIELTIDNWKNVSAWGMLIEKGEPNRRIDVIGSDFEDYEAVE